MARFARSGGEANAIAIRIARAASGKDNVAICGYYGWHDWYLSANLSDDKSLDGHLLPGLKPDGVPRNLKNTVFPFTYNNFEELEAIISTKNIGVIKMEVMRNQEPKNNFLHKVRKLATENGIVLIFDECTSGFRETFISSTFWTERIGPTAALATLNVMKNIQSWKIITSIGLEVRKGWQELADNYELKIDHWGMPALAGFSFQSKNELAYKTLITQEMLKKGYLAANSVYSCIDHSKDVIENYFENLDPIFSLIKKCEEGYDIESLIQGSVCHSQFKRLN
jgi:glutamate-1-semialdehyde 2,1-aminomutase